MQLEIIFLEDRTEKVAESDLQNLIIDLNSGKDSLKDFLISVFDTHNSYIRVYPYNLVSSDMSINIYDINSRIVVRVSKDKLSEAMANLRNIFHEDCFTSKNWMKVGRS